MNDLNALPLPELFQALTADGCLSQLVEAMYGEDVSRPGDITTDSVIAGDAIASGAFVARCAGVVAGLLALPSILDNSEDLVELDPLVDDGDECQPGSTIALINGNLAFILMVERMALNLLGRLSGVASLTRQYVQAIDGTRAVICDTRKTTPGMRNLEKYAVRCGGGTLHRLGLFDAALYKDNHLAGIPLPNLADRLTAAIKSVRSNFKVRFVEVEADSLDQMRELLRIPEGLLHMILLDNMPLDQLRQAVRLRDQVRPNILLEASGGVTLRSVRAIAETGVDRISVGALTHSAPNLDLGLDLQ